MLEQVLVAGKLDAFASHCVHWCSNIEARSGVALLRRGARGARGGAAGRGTHCRRAHSEKSLVGDQVKKAFSFFFFFLLDYVCQCVTPRGAGGTAAGGPVGQKFAGQNIVLPSDGTSGSSLALETSVCVKLRMYIS